jgi:hypothetical protein
MATKAKRGQRRKLPKLEYPKRPRIVDSEVVKRWIWRSRCGRYRVVRSHYKLAVSKPNKDRIADVFYSMAQVEQGGDAEGWLIIGRHASRKAAEQTNREHLYNLESSNSWRRP